MKITKFLIIFCIIYVFSIDAYSQADDDDSWLDKSNKFFNDSSQSISSALGKTTLEDEVVDLLNTDSNKINTVNKINGIRDYLDNYSELKEKDQTGSCTSFIFLSTDCGIEIDKVLSKIEKIVFDGEVITYSELIRRLRVGIQALEAEKVSLNEASIFANDEERLKIQEEISKKEITIIRYNELIKSLEKDLRIKMRKLGIDLTIDQIRVMTTRVDGDDLAKSIAIFDVTRQISSTLGELMKQNSFSGDTTTKYYGVYSILSEILGYTQREYIKKIDDDYLKKLAEIKEDSYKSIDIAKSQIGKAKSKQNKEILENNVKSEEYAIEVIDYYISILEEQKSRLQTALDSTEEQISVAYSSYITASNSANLVSLISNTQSSFDQIMDMQIPDIVPFESAELESEFRKLAEKINLQQ